MLLGEITDARTHAGKTEDELGAWCGKGSARQIDGDMSKGLRSQPRGAPNGRSWSNLINKINNNLGLQPQISNKYIYMSTFW